MDARRKAADTCDFDGLCRAFEGAEVVFHTAGYVGSRPVDWAWRVNAEGPLVAVEAAAAAGCRRVVLTSSISAIGLPADGLPADEHATYPADWMGLTYPDSKHEGERVALDAAARHGVELVVVNPGYVLGVPLDRSRSDGTSSRIVGSYLRGRLPAVMSAPMNFVDVEDVAAGHLLAAERARPGERYILGGHNTTWPALIDRLARISDVTTRWSSSPRGRQVCPDQRSARAAGRPVRRGIRADGPGLAILLGKGGGRAGVPFPAARPDAARDDRLVPGADRAPIVREDPPLPPSTLAEATHALSRVGLLEPFKLGQRLVGRRMIAGV